jgi:glycosyltransferase involved in cell wall biosynthesis
MRCHILFLHNAITEYRIPWFLEMNQLATIDFVFTDENLTKEIYTYDIPFHKISSLHYQILSRSILSRNGTKQIIHRIRHYTFVELPPIDTFFEWLVSLRILFACKRHHIPTGYFWEKWEAPKNTQPLKRRLKNLIIGLAAKSIYQYVDIIFSGSTSSAAYFRQNGVSAEKIVLLHDSSEALECTQNNLRIQYGIPKDVKIILYLGRIIRQKGLDVLIRAFHLLPEKEQYFLLIVGDGDFRLACEELTHTLKLNQVLFTGGVHPDNRRSYFDCCDIFVFPGTFYQGRVDVWGLTINEAMQSGKVVISTFAVGSAIDLIENGVNGYIVTPDHPKELANAIQHANCERMYKSAKIRNKELMNLYSYKNMAKEYIEAVTAIKTNG